MVLYFFFIAGPLWWVILTFAWFAQAGLKWSVEFSQEKSPYFHAFVWTISAVLTVMNVVLKNVEGDIYSGICFIGLWNTNTLLWFVIVPLLLCLVVGVVFLVLGFYSIYRTIVFFKSEKHRTDKLESLMTRIGKEMSFTFTKLYLASHMNLFSYVFRMLFFLLPFSVLYTFILLLLRILKPRSLVDVLARKSLPRS